MRSSDSPIPAKGFSLLTSWRSEHERTRGGGKEGDMKDEEELGSMLEGLESRRA